MSTIVTVSYASHVFTMFRDIHDNGLLFNDYLKRLGAYVVQDQLFVSARNKEPSAMELC